MAVELAHVLITPYSIVKSRTGGIISRILSRCDLDLVDIQMFTPDENLVRSYASSLLDYKLYGLSQESAKLLSDYAFENMMPTSGRPHRVMLLLFKGENAISKLLKVCGTLFEDELLDDDSEAGENVRDTYADLVWADRENRIVKYFEPAVFVARTAETVKMNLQLFASYLKTVPNIVENVKYKNHDKIERTLVIIKPDNWTYASSRPGSIIDMFSRTGLRIVGCKVFRMSVAQALEFYGPGKDGLVEKLSGIFGAKAAELLERNFDINLDDTCRNSLIEGFGRHYGINQFEKIVEFMSGIRPDNCLPEDLEKPGRVKSMVLIYEGEQAISKIREVLGPTDPTKAPGGTIRKEFGFNVMINSAHASDSVENAKREMRIVRIEDNTLVKHIEEFYAGQ